MQENAHGKYLSSYILVMLRNVLEDYISGVKDERDFDAPILSLLRAMGFYDIHFTHGRGEIGKDFIAKRIIDGTEYQCAIQSKRGDINQGKFTTEVYPQLLLASISGLSHPQFDKTLPRRVYLATTGRLKPDVALIFQDLNDQLETQYQKDRVVFWGKEQFIQYFEEYGLTGIHQFTVKGFSGYAEFFLTYSKALDGKLTEREIEEYSRLWLDETIEYRKRILRAAIEAEIIAGKLSGNGLLYEAVTSYLSLGRIVLAALYEKDDKHTVDIYKQIVEENIIPLCKTFHSEFKSGWEASSKSLLALAGEGSGLPMLQYIVWCARVLELSSLYYFLSKDKSVKEEIINFLLEFLEKEPGCGHIPSDRYAVSVVWTVLALVHSEKRDEAIKLIRRGVVWLCNHVEKGFGISRFDADEYEETATLLGYPFEAIKVRKNRSSFFATILADLLAFIGDKDFYRDVVHDFEACEIAFHYWQFPDTTALFTIKNDECRTYVNVPHRDGLGNFEDFDYAAHVKDEPQSFQIVEKAGADSLVVLSTFLKDRYFPTMWKQILTEGDSTN